MRIHGLRYETQASVEVNSTVWTPINSSTVTLLGHANAYGGIGGGFSTLDMTMPLATGAIKTGTNSLSFRFNGTDGRVSGFRVLSFNVLDASGNPLIPASTFVNDDPNTWQPPSTAATDIAAGKNLWYTAPLTKPTPGGPVAIQARCTNCHAQDGRDLKYFNYSNNSIRTRAMFHGLTAQQGDQIASYIRSLDVVNPGRPWNPPYQPGPGLDSKPVIEWAAGAGIDAVLNSDQEMLDAMFPSGIQASVFSADGNLSVRETPVAFQLPDWNQWLPGTHPMDAFGADFINSGYNTVYQTMRANLKVLDPVAYVGQTANTGAWFTAYYGLYVQEGQPIWNNPSTMWTATTVDQMYSLPQWGMVKMWEMMNEFQLEGLAQSYFGPQADSRAWFGQQPFFTSPHMLKMPASPPGLRNGNSATKVYLAYIWYHLQLILNNSNKRQVDHFPIDWGYSYGFVKEMGQLSSPQAALHIMWLIKGLQISNNGYGPDAGSNAPRWQPWVNQIALLTTPEANFYEWTGVPPATRIALCEGMITSWLNQVTKFTPQQFYTGGDASPTEIPARGQDYGDFGAQVWYMIPQFRYIGVNQTLIDSLASWAQTVWPAANWSLTTTATCAPGPPVVCSTEH